MRKRILSVGFYATVLLLAAVLVSTPTPSAPHPLLPAVAAHNPSVPTISEYGTPTVDGVIQPGEYHSCYTENSGTIYAMTFCEKNDGQNDYYAFQAAAPNDPHSQMVILFDNNHDGSTACAPNFAEDAIGMSVPNIVSGPARFYDLYYCGQPPTGSSYLPIAAPFLNHDEFNGGTVDGSGMETYSTATNTYMFELSHPMNSGDSNGHDYSLSAGSTVGWCVAFLNGLNMQVTYLPVDCASSQGRGYGDVLKLGSSAGVCDLAITKTFSQSVLQSPGTATITLVVTNPGGATCISPASVQTKVTDILPPGLATNTLVTVNPSSGWTCPDPIGSTTVQCTTNNIMTYPLTPPITISFGVTVNVQGNTLTNCANVSNPLDQNALNNNDCVTVNVNGNQKGCDLAINKTMTPNPLVHGQTATITLTVWNTGTTACGGPGLATLTTVTENIPQGLTAGLLPPGWIETPQVGWGCTFPTIPLVGPGTITCTNTNPIPPTTQVNPFVTITIPVTVTAPAGSIIHNCAHVDNSLDQNSSNNDSCVDVPVIGGGESLATICVTKFNDLNGNGVQDPGEPGLPGWTINIGSQLLGTTNSTGQVCVTVTAPGTYTISEVLQPGWTQTSPSSGSYTVTVTPGQVVNLSFGNWQTKENLATICVTKFNDSNGNGVQDPAESGLSGWTINVGSLSGTTNSTGKVCFNVPAPGTYTVSEVLQAGWTQTSPPPPGTYTVTVSPGQLVNLSFGNHFAGSTGEAEICVTKFNDLNGDGVQQLPNGEVGLQGWTINIKDSNGNIIATIITDSAGKGCRVVPAPATYTVSEVQQSGWTPTAPPLGTTTVTVSSGLVPLTFGNQQAKGVCDLALNKTVTPNPVQSGGQVAITLTLKNVGGAACPPGSGLPTGPGTIVEDDQPTGLSFNPPSLTQTDPAWTCSFTPGLLCLNPNTLPANYQATFTFTATVAASAGPTIQNCANVINSHDTVPGNNQSCVIINVTKKCIIATAAYGSDLAPPVQFLRNFRDNEVQKTNIGAGFMAAFNNWYYSWAPGVAQQIAPNENYKAATRVLISPLIGSLYVGNMLFAALATASPELAILSAGLLTSAIIGLVYLGPLYGLVWKLSKRRMTKRTIYSLAIVAAALTCIATLTTGTFNLSANMTAFAVIETMFLTPAFILRKMLN